MTKMGNLPTEIALPFNERAQSLAKLVGPKKGPSFQRPNGSFTPDFYVDHKISAADIIGGIKLKTADFLGNETSHYFELGARFFGLSHNDYKEMLMLAEDIHRYASFHKATSFITVRDLLLQWIEETYRGFIKSDLCDFLVHRITALIKHHSVWVPVAYLNVEKSFRIGNVEFKTISRELIEGWYLELLRRFPEDKNNSTLAYNNYRKSSQGLAAGVTGIEADSKRAEEVAVFETERALALLRFFSPANFSPEINCNCVVKGQDVVRSIRTLELEEAVLYPRSSNLIERGPINWVLSARQIDELLESGLRRLSDMLEEQERNDFKNKILECLLIYSKVSISKELSEKLIYLFSSIEGLLLRDKTENMGRNFKRRFVGLLSESNQEGNDITRNLNSMWQSRSNFIHHAQTVVETEALTEFMRNVWGAFMRTILDSHLFRTHGQFLEALDKQR